MWQIIDGDHYKKISDIAASYTVKSEAVRGEILDAEGNPLAINKACFNIVIDKLYLKTGEENSAIELLLELAAKYNIDWEDNLPIAVSDDGAASFISGKDDEIEYLKSYDMLNMNTYSGADDCMSSLRERYMLDSGIYTENMRRNIISVRYNMEKTGYSMTTPYIFAKDIDEKLTSTISEEIQGFSGIDIKTYYKREYKNGSLASHIVGTCGLISEDEFESLKDKGYSFNDTVGKTGIEYGMEEYLKGTPGEKLLSRSADGKVTLTSNEVKTKPGNTVYLTIDSKLQEVTNKSLAKNIKAARENGKAQNEKKSGEDCKAGAAVVLNVKDFSVLAASTYPTFDLSKYSEYNYYSSLVNNESKPLFNRAFNGTYAPGSIFKACVASAALQEGVIVPTTEIKCTHIYDYFKADPVACLGTHGYIDMYDAMAKSCNYYFAEVGRLLGIEALFLYAQRFGLGVKTGVEIYESKGTLAGRDNDIWHEANTVKAAIGQSDNAFTPIQLATYVATIANNGVRLKTHLVKKVVSYDKSETVYENDPNSPEIIDETGISQKNIDYVKNAMKSVAEAEYGTANSVFGDYPIKIGAKTGTAENSGSDHVTFICFAPFDEPEIAIAVVLENGARGRYSMSVAKDIMDAYFGIEQE